VVWLLVDAGLVGTTTFVDPRSCDDRGEPPARSGGHDRAGTGGRADRADGIDDQEKLGFEATHPGLIGEDDALAVADSLVPGLAVALIVWENAGAADIAEAAQDAGAVVLAYEHIPTDDVDLILTALESAEA
jgi:hypothetical protein